MIDLHNNFLRIISLCIYLLFYLLFIVHRSVFFKVLKIQIFSISSRVIAKTPKALEIAQEMISKKLHFFNYC